MGSFCRDLFDSHQVEIIPNHHIGIIMLIIGILYYITSPLTLIYIKYQERRAIEGSVKALKTSIFPVFSTILLLNIGVNILVGTIALSFTLHPYGSTSIGSKWAFAIVWTLQHFVTEGVAILLMQKGLGVNALKKALKYTLVWSFYFLFNQLAVYHTSESVSFASNIIWQSLLILFYLLLWLAPQKRLYRRPAAIIYAKFWVFIRSINIISTIMFYLDLSAGNCFYGLGTLLPYVFFEPTILTYTLIQDSRWWQGLDISQGRRVESAEEIRSPLAGVDIDLYSAKTLAEQLDSLGVKSNQGIAAPVKLLNFAYISLNKNKLLGSGSFSKVYMGSYRQKQCAIKLIFTIDLTEDIISRIAAESQLLSTIKSPNVVDILGVSVLPPSVCILLELCEFGSLTDVIGSTGFTSLYENNPNNFMQEFLFGGPIIGKYSNKMLNITWADRIYLAIGCAKGLLALHTCSKGLCHRDVKSFNFLVDSQLNAKISDLELGMSESLLRSKNAHNSKATNKINQKATRLTSIDDEDGDADDSENVLKRLSMLSIGSTLSFSIDFSALTSNNTIKSDEFLANWAAPEVITKGAYSKASDIYSLGLVFWELISGSVPFNHLRNQDDIRYEITQGNRPIIPDIFKTGKKSCFFLPYIRLIERCWKDNPSERPTCREVVEELETIYEAYMRTIIRDSAVKPPDNSSIQNRSTFSFFGGNSSQFTNLKLEEVEIFQQSFIKESNCINLLESRNENAIILGAEPAYYILWVSNAFVQSIGIRKEFLLGIPFFQLIAFNKCDISVLQSKLKELKTYQSLPSHVIFDIHTLPSNFNYSDLNSIQSYHWNLAKYSAHIYPVKENSSTFSINEKISNKANSPPTLSPIKDISESLESTSTIQTNFTELDNHPAWNSCPIDQDSISVNNDDSTISTSPPTSVTNPLPIETKSSFSRSNTSFSMSFSRQSAIRDRTSFFVLNLSRLSLNSKETNKDHSNRFSVSSRSSRLSDIEKLSAIV